MNNVSDAIVSNDIIVDNNQLVDLIRSYVKDGAITPFDTRADTAGKKRNQRKNEVLPLDELLETYKIHAESSVMLDVTKLSLYQYFRPLYVQSPEYDCLYRSLKVQCSFICIFIIQVHGARDNMAPIIVLHSSSHMADTVSMMVVVDGNHRVHALQDLYQNTPRGKREMYRYLKGVVISPAVSLENMEEISYRK